MTLASASRRAVSARNGSERNDLRLEIRMPCELLIGRRSHRGTILDATARGLSIRTGANLDRGTMLRVVMRGRRGSPVDLEAMVWHRRPAPGPTSAVRLGVILVRAPDDFPRWMGLSESKPKAPKPGRTAETPAFERDRPEQQRRYRVRLAQNSGSRTRSLSLTAATEENARVRALAEIEGDWKILEIRPWRGGDSIKRYSEAIKRPSGPIPPLPKDLERLPRITKRVSDLTEFLKLVSNLKLEWLDTFGSETPEPPKEEQNA